MAQGLHLSQRLAMSQVLAPQLQQSLALLQAPTLELRALVEQELQQNIALEEVSAMEAELQDKADKDGDVPMTDAADPSEPPADMYNDPATAKESKEPVDDFQAEFEKLTQMDQEWRDYYNQTNIPQRSNEDDEERRQFMFDSLTSAGSLQESLLEQIRLSDLPEDDRQIAELLVGNIDDKGFLQTSIQDMAMMTSLPVVRIEEVLKRLQVIFHPAGIGARDLRECLMLQLDRQDRQKTIEYKILDEHFDALGKRRIPEIARGLGISLDHVQEAMARIAHLDPRPGNTFQPESQVYIVPEVFVEKKGEEWAISTNNDHIPRLRISNVYKDLMAQANSSPEIRDYIRDKIRAGKFLIKSIHQRQQTITNIAKEIVKRQAEFFEKGVTFLKPLTMVQVAEVVGVHETTVSRAVSGKYMQTPQGIFEMKYFFTSGIDTEDGAGVSNTSVKDMVAEMFKNEDTTKPLSDQEVVAMLKVKGINLARRTVAKYRSELNILPSNLRKVY
jgi:RNA polymerase sigma-54 factor